jgi:hypothetical protein
LSPEPPCDPADELVPNPSAAAIPMLLGARSVPLSSLQFAVSNGPQSIDDACATISLGAPVDGTAGFAGFV